LRRALLLAPAAAAIAFMHACGGGDTDAQDLPDDEEARRVAGIAELATNAYATAGVSGLADYLAPEVLRQCSIEEIASHLAGQPVPIAYRTIEDIEIEDDRGRAGVIQAFGDDEERRVDWTFVRTDAGAWRVASVPGLERCAG
jgi:hypothetical protein